MICALPWTGARSAIQGSGPPQGAAQASKATRGLEATSCRMQVAEPSKNACAMARCSKPLPAPCKWPNPKHAMPWKSHSAQW